MENNPTNENIPAITDAIKNSLEKDNLPILILFNTSIDSPNEAKIILVFIPLKNANSSGKKNKLVIVAVNIINIIFFIFLIYL